jgi:endonuclease/exonuclease/phosphatase family metal-dependent hydrolase
MRIATWNLNHRVGRVAFRPEAAEAATRLDADVLAFTEYFPRMHDQSFRRSLETSGWAHQLISEDPSEISNRVLVVSRIPIGRDELPLPTFDRQLPANVLALRVPSLGLRVLALRVPAYTRGHRSQLIQSWEWIERAATGWRTECALILGDLNVTGPKPRAAGGAHLRRLMESGWGLARPEGEFSYWSPHGCRAKIDHLLSTAKCRVTRARYVAAVNDCVLAGARGALSDHAALVAEVTPG